MARFQKRIPLVEYDAVAESEEVETTVEEIAEEAPTAERIHNVTAGVVDRTAAVYAAFGAEAFATYAKGKAIEALFNDKLDVAVDWLSQAISRLRAE